MHWSWNSTALSYFWMLKSYLTKYDVGDFLTELNKTSLSRFLCLLNYTLKVEHSLLNIRHSFRFTYCQCWRYSRLCFHNYIVYSVCIQPICWPALKILYFNVRGWYCNSSHRAKVVSTLLQQHIRLLGPWLNQCKEGILANIITSLSR